MGFILKAFKPDTVPVIDEVLGCAIAIGKLKVKAIYNSVGTENLIITVVY